MPEITTVDFIPGGTIRLDNRSSVTQKYQISFGEYGSITFDALVGAEVIIDCGNFPPTITLLETSYKPGVNIVNPQT